MNGKPMMQTGVMPTQKAGITSVPVLVKVISVLYYIGAVSGLISGVLFIAGAGLVSSLFSTIPFLGSLGSGLFIVVGIVFLALGVFGFFIARGLWKGKNWTRVIVIIFSALGALWAIFFIVQGSIINGVINLLVNGFIGGYLLFSKNVKEAFAGR